MWNTVAVANGADVEIEWTGTGNVVPGNTISATPAGKTSVSSVSPTVNYDTPRASWLYNTDRTLNVLSADRQTNLGSTTTRTAMTYLTAAAHASRNKSTYLQLDTNLWIAQTPSPIFNKTLDPAIDVGEVKFTLWVDGWIADRTRVLEIIRDEYEYHT